MIQRVDTGDHFFDVTGDRAIFRMEGQSLLEMTERFIESVVRQRFKPSHKVRKGLATRQGQKRLPSQKRDGHALRCKLKQAQLIPRNREVRGKQDRRGEKRFRLRKIS